MKKLATALLALILALGCTVSAFAVETEASAIGVHLPQQLERLETLKTTAVSQEINPAITVKNDNEDSSEVLEVTLETVEQLPDYNDGIISSLNTDTEIVETYNVRSEKSELLDNLLSTSNILVQSPNVTTSNMVIAYEDVLIETLSFGCVGNANLIYSMNGDITIDATDATFTGIIYAPNGTVTILGDSFKLHGNIVAEEVIIKSSDFIYTYDENVNYLCNLLSSTELNLIKSVDEQYGEFFHNVDYEHLAKYVVMANVEGALYDDIYIYGPIEMLDANDVVSNYGFNFEVNSVQGYVILGAHSKTTLVNLVCLEKALDTTAEVYCFAGGEVYYRIGNYYSTTDGARIDNDEFERYKAAKSSYALNLNEELLEQLEVANLNIISELSQTGEESFNVNLLSSTHYEGTDDNAYGYGGIQNISTYLKNRYGGTPSVSDSGKSLSINTMTMSTVSGKSANNCSLVAISKVLYYYKLYQKKTGIDASIYDIYDVVEDIATGYGYNDTDGTFPTKINNIMHDAFEHYGYSSVCNGVYVWSFNNEVKNEISAERPVVMNILRGYYGNHSITVAGYSVWKTNNTEYPMIKVVDGWKSGYRYVDYNAFAYDLATSGFGSFNTARVG